MECTRTNEAIIEPFNYLDQDEVFVVTRNNNYKVRCENCVDLVLGRCINMAGCPTVKSDIMGCRHGYDVRKKVYTCKYYNFVSGFCNKENILVFDDKCKQCKHQKSIYNRDDLFFMFRRVFYKFINIFRR